MSSRCPEPSQARRFLLRSLRAGLTLGLIACASCSGENERRPEPASGAAPAPAAKPPRPRLIVLISLDTLRADHLGAYGYSRPTSPNLDALAANGVVFEDASSTSPWTLPSHASMMTGLFPARHGVVSSDRRLGKRVETLAEAIAEAGYATYSVVNTPWLQRDVFGFMRGFERTLFVKGGGDRVAPNTLVTDQAIQWLGRETPEPKFVFVHYIDAHSDYVALPEHEARFVGAYSGPVIWTTNALFRLRVSDAFLARCAREPDAEACLDHEGQSVVGALRPGSLDEAQLRHMIDRYDAGIHQLDAELSRLFDAIDAAGDPEHTVVIVTSDHGEEFREHGSFFHAATQYQEVLRVPLIMQGADFAAGHRVAEPVSLVDLMPTLLELARVRTPPAMDGQSLRALARGEADPAFRERALFAEAPGEYGEVLGPEHAVAVRRGPFKLHRIEPEGRLELYDLTRDPGEGTNLVVEQPERAERLLRLLDAHHGVASSGADDARPVELSEEDRRALEALGYLEGGKATPERGQGEAP